MHAVFCPVFAGNWRRFSYARQVAFCVAWLAKAEVRRGSQNGRAIARKRAALIIGLLPGSAKFSSALASQATTFAASRYGFAYGFSPFFGSFGGAFVMVKW